MMDDSRIKTQLRVQIRASERVLKKWENELASLTGANWYERDRINQLAVLISRKKGKINVYKTKLAAYSDQSKPKPETVAKITNPKPPSSRDRLDAYIAEHPDYLLYQTLQGLADEIVCTRERVRQLMPDFARRKRSIKDQIAIQSDISLMKKIEQLLYYDCPEAILPKSYGGWGMAKILTYLGMKKEDGAILHGLFETLDLPRKDWLKKQLVWDVNERIRHRWHTEPELKKRKTQHTLNWMKRNPEKIKGYQTKASKTFYEKRKATVIGAKICAICGKEFPWTEAREKSSVYNYKRVLCSDPACRSKLAKENVAKYFVRRGDEYIKRVKIKISRK